MEKLTVERSVWIAAPREKVWQAVTEPAQLEKWFAPGCTWEIAALEVGAEVKFYNTPDDIALHTIETIDPLRQFALRWYEENNLPMLTTFWLEEENGGTRITVTETGFENLPEAIRQRRVEQTIAGYTDSMQNLKNWLEGGLV